MEKVIFAIIVLMYVFQLQWYFYGHQYFGNTPTGKEVISTTIGLIIVAFILRWQHRKYSLEDAAKNSN